MKPTITQTVSQKLGYYKEVSKVALKSPAVVSTALVAGSMLFGTEAMAAAGVTNEINFSSLGDEAIDSIKNGGKTAVAVLGVGITIVGGFKGYSILKRGINRA